MVIKKVISLQEIKEDEVGESELDASYIAYPRSHNFLLNGLFRCCRLHKYTFHTLPFGWYYHYTMVKLQRRLIDYMFRFLISS